MGLIKKAKRGFTLVELVVVIAVIAVLAAVSVGAYFGITESANKSKLEQEARGILNNIQLISNGNDSNSYMDKDGVHIKDINAYEARLNEMSGMTYDVVTEEPTTISRQTVWFINTRVDEPSTQVSLSPSSYTTYYRFGYYTPDVGGKIANYSFLTDKCEIVSKDFNIEEDESEDIAPGAGTIYATYFEVPTEINVKVGTQTQLTVSNVTPSNGKFSYEVTSNNCFEFEPSNGFIRGISQGAGSIRVYANDYSKTVRININPETVKITGLNVSAIDSNNNTISEVNIGDTFGIKVDYVPSNTTELGYEIHFSPAGSVTKVNEKYKANSAGNVTIIATSTKDGTISSSTTINVKPILASSISVSGVPTKMEKDDIATISVTVDSSATDKTYKYKIIDVIGENVISYDINTNKLTAINPGKATIQFISNDGNASSAVYEITVDNYRVTEFVASATDGKTNLKAGESNQINWTVSPKDKVSQEVTFNVTGDTVTVDQNGLVSAKEDAVVGSTATVTLTSQYDTTKTATITYTIIETKVERINVSLSKTSILNGEECEISYVIQPSTATNKDVDIAIDKKLSSGSATLNGNKLIATGAGQVVIEVSAKDGSGIVGITTLQITEVLVKEIHISTNNLINETISVGDTSVSVQINSISPANAANKQIEWVSTNPDLLSVDSEGKLTAHQTNAHGTTAEIYARATDGSNVVSNKIQITVTNIRTIYFADTEWWAKTSNSEYTKTGIVLLSNETINSNDFSRLGSLMRLSILTVGEFNIYESDVDMIQYAGAYFTRIGSDGTSDYGFRTNKVRFDEMGNNDAILLDETDSTKVPYNNNNSNLNDINYTSRSALETFDFNLSGSFNNWNKDDINTRFTTIDNNVYTLSNIELFKGDEFKIYLHKYDKWITTKGDSITSENANNYLVTANGVYTISLDVCQKTLTVLKTAEHTKCVYSEEGQICKCGQRNPEYLFLKPNNNWLEGNARFAAYFFDGGEISWVSMSDKNNDGIYEVKKPDEEYNKVIFCRMNPDKIENNWDNRWNETGNLTIPTGQNLFTIPDGDWDGSTTNWS